MKRTKFHPIGLVLFILFFAFLVPLALFIRGDSLVPRRVTILGVPVETLTKEATLAYLEPYSLRLLKENIILSYPTGHILLSPYFDLGMGVDLNETVEAVFLEKKQSSFFAPIFRLWNREYDAIHRTPSLVFCRDTTLDYLEDRLRPLNQEPHDARFVMEGEGITIKEEQWGQSVDYEEVLTRFLSVLWQPAHRVVFVSFYSETPRVQSATLREMGITHRLTQFSTPLLPSSSHRTHNIQLASQAFHGLLLPPNARVSFNEQVGPRTKERGYLEAPVILYGELVDDLGGGVCQVSSTLYNALLLVGMTSRSRTPHSIPSDYVPLGQDATVAYGLIDLRMENTTPYHFLLATQVTRANLTVSVYGPNDVPRYRLVSTLLETLPYTTLSLLDPTLELGTQEIIPGRPGYVVELRRERQNEGGETSELLSISTYPPRSAILRHNP